MKTTAQHSHTAYIGLGANLGAAKATIYQAITELSASPDINSIAVSNIYDTSPVDSSGPNYVNAVACIATNLSADRLLELLQGIELKHGRTRPYKNAPRTLDLDLLLYDNDSIQTANLTVPHPRMHERAFVLQPLLDLAPGLVLKQGPITYLLAQHQDQSIRLLEPWNHKLSA